MKAEKVLDIADHLAEKRIMMTGLVFDNQLMFDTSIGGQCRPIQIGVTYTMNLASEISGALLALLDKWPFLQEGLADPYIGETCHVLDNSSIPLCKTRMGRNTKIIETLELTGQCFTVTDPELCSKNH